ncbi:MAG TPA: outer membrane beta-barrel protein [Blastocatellia bacterium]|jgi:hypothetical protein
MKKVAFLFILLAMTAVSARAQAGDDRKGWGYVVGGAGGATGFIDSALINVGGGGELTFFRGLGLGGEVGYYARTDRIGDGFGIADLNLLYSFNRSGKVSPFVTGGGSVAFRGSAAGGGNIGGGVQYWINDRAAIRFEFRDHIFSSDSPHAYVFRVGVSLR